MQNELSVGFMGSGRFAARCLELLSGGLRPSWVVTNAPKPSGRGLKLQNTPVWDTALALGLPTFTTERLSRDDERIEWIKAARPDVILVIDFGHLVKEPLLSLPRYGCINIHPSKLPQYRGSAPIQRALMDGVTESAVSIFRLDAGMDSGPILAQPPLVIEASDDVNSLFEKAAASGTEALLSLLCGTPPESWRFTEQDETKATCAPKIDKNEGRIDWNATAFEIVNKIRGIGTAPGVFCMARGKRLRVHKAEAVPAAALACGALRITENGPVVGCKEGALLLKEVQPEGKKTQPASDWARGARLAEGEAIE
ncbi:MAG: methionyl-tRNA formyltransferase [Cloacibacillus sp.]